MAQFSTNYAADGFALTPEADGGMSRLETLLSRLARVKRRGRSALARCPAHEDGTPSLSVRLASDGLILLHDFGQRCDYRQILEAVGLPVSILFPPPRVPLTRRSTYPKRVSRGGSLSLREESLRLNGTSVPYSRCSQPRRVAVVKDGRLTLWRVGCQRATDPGCRPYVLRRQADRLLRTFDGLPCWWAEVAAEDWEATRKRVQRGGGKYVQVPAPEQGRFIFATVEPTADAHWLPPANRTEVVLALFDSRPVDPRRMRGTKGFLIPAAKSGERGEVVGFWSERLSVEQVERRARHIDVPTARTFERYDVQALSVDVDIGDHKLTELLALVGFHPRNGTAWPGLRDTRHWQPHRLLPNVPPPADLEPPPNVLVLAGAAV